MYCLTCLKNKRANKFCRIVRGDLSSKNRHINKWHNLPTSPKAEFYSENSSVILNFFGNKSPISTSEVRPTKKIKLDATPDAAASKEDMNVDLDDNDGKQNEHIPFSKQLNLPTAEVQTCVPTSSCEKSNTDEKLDFISKQLSNVLSHLSLSNNTLENNESNVKKAKDIGELLTHKFLNSVQQDDGSFIIYCKACFEYTCKFSAIKSKSKIPIL